MLSCCLRTGRSRIGWLRPLKWEVLGQCRRIIPTNQVSNEVASYARCPRAIVVLKHFIVGREESMGSCVNEVDDPVIGNTTKTSAARCLRFDTSQ